MATDAKRWMLDNLAFLDWFVTYIPSRQHWLLDDTKRDLARLNLATMPKRGILVKLERDWKEIDFGNLIKHGVPIYYPWTTVAAQDKRFSRFNPDILRDYHEDD
ncbi:hypothetical protein Hypma_000075 [Hypsizygus marmoreus]|uniref:Uncharacterized protein n=1 Tax=Hypsizygus marmoreus TaxID=39966 RepID=A0A369KDK3_HYPMA|nr:hypothetical protein Hypma_000075 [Hypsizygus marmoreus]